MTVVAGMVEPAPPHAAAGQGVACADQRGKDAQHDLHLDGGRIPAPHGAAAETVSAAPARASPNAAIFTTVIRSRAERETPRPSQTR